LSTTICDICKNKNSQCPLCLTTGTYKYKIKGIKWDINLTIIE